MNLQKTKIPARGLKHRLEVDAHQPMRDVTSKNQNPREGIETYCNLSITEKYFPSSKNQNPREGIETFNIDKSVVVNIIASKNQNPREGIESRATRVSPQAARHDPFKKPKSPRGD